MRHCTLTCLNHPDLRWSCKEIAVTKIGQYNGARNIFYLGTVQETRLSDGSFDYKWQVPECKCSPADLRFAPESFIPEFPKGWDYV